MQLIAQKDEMCKRKNDSITISVLVPVYNVEKYLVSCIESVLEQSEKVFEIILVDDGSTDRSGIICDDYALRYSQIRAFHKKNQGILSARRYGIEKAQGEWFKPEKIMLQ